MNSSDTPLIKLPGNGFTLWTDPERALKGWEENDRLHLPGNQFTVWTKPELVAKSVETKSTALSSGTPATAKPCCRGHWLGRLALLGTVGIVALALWSLYSTKDTIRQLREEKKAVGAKKIEFFNVAVKAQQSARDAHAQKADLETLAETTGQERDGAKKALAATEQALKTAEIDSAAKTTKLNEASRELAALKKELSDKEQAMANSLDTMKAEKSKLQQAFEQKDLEMKNLTAKSDEEKAVALRDSAAAMTQIGEMKTEMDGLRKEVEALKAAAKAAPVPPVAPVPAPAQ